MHIKFWSAVNYHEGQCIMQNKMNAFLKLSAGVLLSSHVINYKLSEYCLLNERALLLLIKAHVVRCPCVFSLCLCPTYCMRTMSLLRHCNVVPLRQQPIPNIGCIVVRNLPLNLTWDDYRASCDTAHLFFYKRTSLPLIGV
jgi:hypothetical protein